MLVSGTYHQQAFPRIRAIGSIKLIPTLDQIDSLHDALTIATTKDNGLK
jgi:hypothetical protein